MANQKLSGRARGATTTRLKRLLFSLWILLLAPATASAAVVAGLFEVNMTILDESREIRAAALDDGLIEVLIRVSGDSRILEKIEAPRADSYVQQYEYSAQGTAAAGAAGVQQAQRLWVRYNAAKVLDFLRKQAIPIWGEHRSQAVIWLAVRDGGQRYMLKAADNSPVKDQLDQAFTRRGIPAIWPEQDEEDQLAVRFADVWAGFAGPLQQASNRYSSGPVIAASMDWAGAEWRGEWSLFMDEEVRKWSLNGPDYAALIAKATDLIADAMGQKFAVLETFDPSQQQTVSVAIEQVKTVEAFRRIEKYLSSLSVVQSVQLSQVEPERVSFDLILRARAEDLLNLIQSGSILARIADEPAITPTSSEPPVTLDANTTTTTDMAGNVLPAAPVPVAPVKPVPYRFVLR